MIKMIIDFFRIEKTDEAERYLANSISLQDLETRQRQIAKGEAPFQQYAQMISRGWIQ